MLSGSHDRLLFQIQTLLNGGFSWLAALLSQVPVGNILHLVVVFGLDVCLLCHFRVLLD